MKTVMLALMPLMFVLSLPVSAADPHRSGVWHNPSPMQHAFDAGDAPMHVFAGTMTLDGILHLSWLDDEELMATFSPDRSSRKRLPHIRDGYHTARISIRLNAVPLDAAMVWKDGVPVSAHERLPDNAELIQAAFGDIPASFWQDKKGEILRPATIAIRHFAIDFECDARQYYATASAIKPLAKTARAKIVQGC